MGWAVKWTSLKSILIARDHRFKPVYSWIENITIKGKAVRGPSRIRRNCATEPIESYLFVRIVILKDITHTSDSLQILIAVRIKVVKWLWRCWVSIRHSKVDCNSQVDLAATKHILEEWMHALHFAAAKFEISLLSNLKVKSALF